MVSPARSLFSVNGNIWKSKDGKQNGPKLRSWIYRYIEVNDVRIGVFQLFHENR